MTDAEVSTRADEIYDEIYGTSCNPQEANMANENHAFAEGAAEYHALHMPGVWSTFNGSAEWIQKLSDDKTACQTPGASAALFDINSGSSDDCDALITKFDDAGVSTCRDNNIGEIVYAAFLQFCSSHGLTCAHEDLFEVWMAAGEIDKLGWCDAFEAKYTKTWGEFVCYMETPYGISNSCVAADVPCMAYSAGDSDGGDDNDMFMIFIFIGLFVVVMFCAIGTWGWFHWQHLKKKVGTVVSEDEGEKGGIEL